MKSIMETIVTKQLNRDKTVNPKGITGVSVWGLYDTCSWRENIPLLFASGINDPKPIFLCIHRGSKSQINSEVKNTARPGDVVLRGGFLVVREHLWGLCGILGWRAV